KTPTFGSDVLQDVQRRHGVERFVRKRQRLVLLDYYELSVVAEALDIAADDLNAGGIYEARQQIQDVCPYLHNAQRSGASSKLAATRGGSGQQAIQYPGEDRKERHQLES